MSSTQTATNYILSAGPSGSTPGGTSFNVALEITIVEGSDFDDAAVWALHDALVAAFPGAWNIQATDISTNKLGASQTSYASDYVAKTFS